MLLMYGDEQAEAGLSPEEFNELVQAYFRYDDELRQARKYVFAEALQPSSTVRVQLSGLARLRNASSRAS